MSQSSNSPRKDHASIPARLPVAPLTRRFTLKKTDVNSAIETLGRQDYTLSDKGARGLSLRVRRETATWDFKMRMGGQQRRWRIGDARQIRDPQVARGRAIEAANLVHRGIDPETWLREQEHGGAVERHFDFHKDGMTWAQGRDAFLNHVSENRAPATYGDYRRTLVSADFNFFEGKLLKQVVARDIRQLQESVFSRGHVQMAHHVLRIIKSCLSWLSQRSDSGIEVSAAAGVRPIDPGKLITNTRTSRRAGYVPMPGEVGQLAWTLAASEVTPSARLAALLVLMTAQRIETVLTARKAHFTRIDGGMAWIIPAAHMKSKDFHVIPLCATAWRAVQSAITLTSEDTKLVFPQTRRRRKDLTMDGHLSYTAVRDAMGEVVAPHDLRRAFATHGRGLLKFTKEAIKRVLDHAEGEGGDITAEHYDLSLLLDEKRPTLEMWEAWVLEQIRDAAPDGVGEVPQFMR